MRSQESRNSHPTVKNVKSESRSRKGDEISKIDYEESEVMGVHKGSKPDGEWWLSSKTVSSKTIRYWISDEINNRDDIIGQLKTETSRYKDRISNLENKFKIKSVDADLKIKDLEQQLENITIDSEMQQESMKKEMSIFQQENELKIQNLEAMLASLQNTMKVIRGALKHAED